jgi:phosphopantothenoylcysteine decarboxylase/phosphopantothenate--cysteine ligase
MPQAFKKRVVLGVSGGIAAYKSPDLVRRLRECGCEVRVVMTPSACEFITPLTMQAVSGQPVHVHLLDERTENAMGHIEIARWCELVLVAPASAGFMARLAHGFADDLLSTVCLATSSPVVLAPAMNAQMWSSPATQTNRRILLERGVVLMGPGEGDQACGEVGVGRMLEPREIVHGLGEPQAPGELADVNVLVTAGPTREAIDPVRFVSNRSSGKMGYAVAAAAFEQGAHVTLVSGPTALTGPSGVKRIDVTTTQEMLDCVMQHVGEHNIFISAAAVADYRPSHPASEKLKKKNDQLTLSMERTPDILAQVAAMSKAPFSVGFAAETEALLENAREKLRRKSLDMIAANKVSANGIGFDSDDNELTVFWGNESTVLARDSKTELARQLVRLVAQRYRAKHPA